MIGFRTKSNKKYKITKKNRIDSKKGDKIGNRKIFIKREQKIVFFMNIINKRNQYKFRRITKKKRKTQIENNRKQRMFQKGNKKQKYFIKVK